MRTPTMAGLLGSVLLTSFALVGCGDDEGPTDVNEPPAATISAPEDGASVQEGTAVTFEGSADDPEDGSLTGDALVWLSDLDGQLGTGQSTSATLSVGEHTVQLAATDSDGATDTASVSVTVTANQAPSATISSPSDGSSFRQDESIPFEGTAEDPEDGSLSGDALVWESDLDGEIGTGESFSVSGLTAGDHTITLTATDSNGATATETVTITVEQVAASATVSPGFLEVATGGTGELTVTVTDFAGDTIQSPSLAFESRNEAVATASGSSLTGQGAGVTDVVATGGEQMQARDSARVAVLESNGFAVLLSGNADDVVTAGGSGAQVTLQLRIQTAPGGSGTIGSLEGSLTWDPAQLSLDSDGSGTAASGWTWTPNTSNAANGELRFNAFSASGSSGDFVLVELPFIVNASAGSMAALDLTVDVAGDSSGAEITSRVEAVDTAIQVP